MLSCKKMWLFRVFFKSFLRFVTNFLISMFTLTYWMFTLSAFRSAAASAMELEVWRRNKRLLPVTSKHP